MVSLLKKTLGTTAGVLLLAAGAIGVVAGCSNTEVTGASDPLASVEGFCDAFATAKCSVPLVSSCYFAAGAAIDADTSRCVGAASASTRCNPDNLPYHPENAAAAIDTITAIYEDGVVEGPSNPDYNELQLLSDALASVFYVGLPDTSECQAVSDCNVGAGSTCVFHSGKGVCAVPVEALPGDSCSFYSQQCGAGYFCDDGLHCVSVNQINQACSANEECVTGKCGANARCQNLLPDTAQCEFGTECAGGFCVKASGDTKDGQCGSIDTFSGFSASCDAVK